MSKTKKIIIAVVLLLIAIPAGVFGYLYFKLNSVHEADKTSEKVLSDTSHTKKSETGVSNILLVGIDARDVKEPSRSDSMMILSVDKTNNNIKLTSLARDTYVDIPGHGKQKLTHAYAYGQIDLLLQTIENNFKIDINDYAVVNFYGFSDIIDALGGVQIDVKASELQELNNCIGDPSKNVTHAGVMTLDGKQALGYARIRHNDSAYGRDNRQRDIITSIVQKAKDVSPLKYPAVLDSVLPHIKTNMNPTDIIKLGTSALKFDTSKVHTLEFPIPDENYSKGGIISKETGWVLQFDADKNLPILHNFIYQNEMPNLPQQ